MADFITRLPLEVIQQIASLCAFRDVLAMGWTCRKFRRACDDPFVLQWCFLNQINSPIPKSLKNKEALRKLILTTPTPNPVKCHIAWPRLASPPSTTGVDEKVLWARLAAAASHLPEFLDELEELLLPYESVPWETPARGSGPSTRRPPARFVAAVKNIVAMLSAWTVLCSPTVNNFSLTASLSGLSARILDLQDGDIFWDTYPLRHGMPCQVAFCLAMGVLGNTVLNNMPVLADRAMNSYKYETWNRSQVRKELEQSFSGTQYLALATLGCLPWILRSDPGVQIRNDLPRPEELPLLRPGGNLPLPYFAVPEGSTPDDIDTANTKAIFSASTRDSQRLDAFSSTISWHFWLRSNVDSLIDEIATGEWMGYVTTSQGRNGDVPAPAKGIHFSSVPDPRDQYGNSILLSAENGVDARGPFRLEGYVERKKGNVRLTKRWVDTNIPAHALIGAVTPLGIVGCWAYHSADGIPMGFMWLYKKEWTAAS